MSLQTRDTEHSSDPVHERVHVDLGSRSYPIEIGPGLLSKAGALIAPLAPSGRVAVVTDETVNALHGETLKTSLTAAGLEVLFIVRPSGEAQKRLSSLEDVLNALFEAGFERNETLIAFGGGVIGDLTGFAASIYKRGCPFIQIPTTLLAQVDSSVGGKTAINNPHGKNLIGAFYQPRLVLADTDVLDTLPLRERQAGYAEVLKYGLLGDAAFFDWLEVNGADVLAGASAATTHAIAVSCQTKARIVAADEFERGQRALLNLGHTFGHALEAEAGYDGDLLHGEAVSAGMLMAFEFSQHSGLCVRQDVERVRKHLKIQNLMTTDRLKPLLRNPDHLLAHMDQDKKNEGGQLTLILARKIGECFVEKSADRAAVRTYLETLSQRPKPMAKRDNNA